MDAEQSEIKAFTTGALRGAGIGAGVTALGVGIVAAIGGVMLLTTFSIPTVAMAILSHFFTCIFIGLPIVAVGSAIGAIWNGVDDYLDTKETNQHRRSIEKMLRQPLPSDELAAGPKPVLQPGKARRLPPVSNTPPTIPEPEQVPPTKAAEGNRNDVIEHQREGRDMLPEPQPPYDERSTGRIPQDTRRDGEQDEGLAGTTQQNPHQQSYRQREDSPYHTGDNRQAGNAGEDETGRPADMRRSDYHHAPAKPELVYETKLVDPRYTNLLAQERTRAANPSVDSAANLLH